MTTHNAKHDLLSDTVRAVCSERANGATRSGGLSEALRLGVAGLLLGGSLTQAAPERPNVLVVMADDMGYSDLGCYGSEIPTPNLDALATNGIRMLNFHNCARCCPSRASILTGQYPQRVGVGYMTARTEFTGYQGALAHPHVGFAEIARAAGYFTGMSGKWHVNPADPRELGFDRADTMTFSGTSYFYPFDRGGSAGAGAVPTAEEAKISQATYVTEWYADGVCNYLDETAMSRQPFLIYWTPTAPHYPLQCKQSDLDTMRGRYDAGPQAAAEARYRRMLELGIVKPEWPFSLPDAITRPDTNWNNDVRTDADPWPPPPDYVFRNKKNKEMGCARRSASFAELMEIYAAQVVSMDREVGRVVEKLRNDGRLENTLIVFLSDNGASNEGESNGSTWAQLSNLPFPKYKKQNEGGGNRTSCILHWPARIAGERRGSLDRSYGHVIDILPTIVDVVDGTYPAQDRRGRALPPLPGRSLTPILDGQARRLPDSLFFEHGGNLAVVNETWKLVCNKGTPWRLYSMANDPLEQVDLAAAHPDIVLELAKAWQAWADANYARACGERAGQARLDAGSYQPPR